MCVYICAKLSSLKLHNVSCWVLLKLGLVDISGALMPAIVTLGLWIVWGGGWPLVALLLATGWDFRGDMWVQVPLDLVGPGRRPGPCSFL